MGNYWNAFGGEYAYSPYGEATALGPDGGNSLQYTGRENDQTGLYYYRARYYDPALKRFVSEDPIGLNAGPNSFTYVRSDPVNLVDPTGLRDVDVYVWNQSGTSVGHVMVTEAGRTTVILSQFPHEPGGESRPVGPSRQLNCYQTWREEARLPDRILRIHVPNDAAFDKAVADHVRRLEWNWLPTTREQTHCARAANDSLKAGGVPLAGQDRGQILPGTLGDLLLRVRQRMTKLRLGLAALAIQGLLLGAISLLYVGFPDWAEIPYVPFQALLVAIIPGAYWPIGLVLGVCLGMASYSALIAIVAFAVWGSRKRS